MDESHADHPSFDVAHRGEGRTGRRQLRGPQAAWLSGLRASGSSLLSALRASGSSLPYRGRMSERTLLLMRHAKSGYPAGVVDRERPLAPRGIREAGLAGKWLR